MGSLVLAGCTDVGVNCSPMLFDTDKLYKAGWKQQIDQLIVPLSLKTLFILVFLLSTC